MICELQASAYVDRKGRRLWSGNDMVYVSDYLIAENALDWLWQKINRVEGELMVELNRNSLYVTNNRLQIPNDDIPILFAGTAREIVQQLRPYMAMMEGG